MKKSKKNKKKMRTRYQRKVSNLAIRSNNIQLLAYNLNFNEKYDSIRFWTLHECVSLFQQYLEEERYDEYTSYGSCILNFLEKEILPNMKETDENLKKFMDFYKSIEEVGIKKNPKYEIF